ncbi:radical SAM family RiPP maturation amino acid epimerase [Rhabdochromatium marinum]|uniref:radical SAM family RiPP maturation amino acid epimerase n=1 Tax=Rhabdochromatium marinum TaxID=48729 RepID=UPI001904C0E9|nr:radical SAM family RiPP maturation amino acid epimerase [Rhabdochromatium marinum]
MTLDAFWERERAWGFYPLLEAPRDAPEDYALEVALVKRVLECWNIDPAFRDAWARNPQRALEDRQIALQAADVAPLLASEPVPEATDPILKAVYQGRDLPDQPQAVRRYCAHLREKLHWRQAHRRANQPTDPRMAAWWERQVARLSGQMHADKADAIVHTPVSFELSEGCSVGCWFCALASEPLQDRIWRATPEHRVLWRSVLQQLKERIGPAVGNAFCYWATEPFDNPDYEVFLQDFQQVLGRVPQSTTARPTATIERTRALLRLSEGHGVLNRFSILSRDIAQQVHAAFSARELLLTELLPQNRDANPKFRKARAGRILESANPALTQTPTTIACVSGFLINLWAQRIQLITPCPASAVYPKGYQVLDEALFTTAEDFGLMIECLISKHMLRFPPLDAPVRLRPDVRIECPDASHLLFRALAKRVTLANQPHSHQLAELLEAGANTPAAIAEAREQAVGIDCQDSLFLINHLFDLGLFEETH